MATYSLIAVVVTLVVGTAVISFVYGWIAHGNFAHRYPHDRAEAMSMESVADHRQCERDTVRAKWEAERSAQPVVNVYIAALGWPVVPLTADNNTAGLLPGPVIDEQVVRGLPAGWS